MLTDAVAREAFAKVHALLRRRSPWIESYDRDDIAQSAILRYLEHAPSDTANAVGYVLTCARSLAFDAHSGRGRAGLSHARADTEAGTTEAEIAIASRTVAPRAEDRVLAREALAAATVGSRYPAHDARIFQAHHAFGVLPAEAPALFGESPKAYANRVARLTRRVRRAFTEDTP